MSTPESALLTLFDPIFHAVAGSAFLWLGVFLVVVLRIFFILGGLVSFSERILVPAHLSSLRGQMRLAAIYQFSRVSRFTTDWVLTTNHKRLAILYFMFILGSGLVGLTLATVVRLEFAYPGQFFIVHTPERYLTIASLHGIVMVFFVVIPLLFGAFANFLLPLQLGVRDVAFPRLNSFMFWLTPSGLVLLMHAIFSDRAHTTTGLVGYGDSRAILRRRFSEVSPEFARFHESSAPSTLAWRLVTITSGDISRPILLRSVAPSFATEPAALWVSRQDADTGHGQRPVAARLKGYSAWEAELVSRFRPSSSLHHPVSSRSLPEWGLEEAEDFSLERATSGVPSRGGRARPLQELSRLSPASGHTLGERFVTQSAPLWGSDQARVEARALAPAEVIPSVANHTSSTKFDEIDAGATPLVGIFSGNVRGSLLGGGLWAACSRVQQLVTLVEGISLRSHKAGLSFIDDRVKEASSSISILPLCRGIDWMVLDLAFYGWVANASNVVRVVDYYVISPICFVSYQICRALNYLFGPLVRLVRAKVTWDPYLGDWEIFTNLFFFTYSLSRYVDKLSWPHVKPVLLFFQRAECEEVGPVALVLSHLIYFFDVSLAGLFTLIPEEVGVCADSTSRPLTFLTVDVTSLPLNVVGRFVNNVASVWLCDFDLTLTRLFADPFTLLSRDLAAFSSPRADYFLTRAINFLEPQLWALYGTFYSEWSWVRALHRSLVFVWSEVPKIPSYLVSWGFFAETSPESTRQLPLANDLSTASILGNTEPRVTCLGLGAIHAARALTLSTSPVYDYLADWRELKLEREVWRSVDLLGLVREGVLGRQKYYSGFYEPAAAASHASAWSPNKLIPGWAFITPYASRLRYTALGKVDLALVVVLIAALGSVFSSINYLITYRYLGAPLLQKRRELRSFFVDALLVSSRMMVLANPALILGIILLLSDRHLGTSVFDFSGGGDTILFQHLFWFFGHPEVYIIIIPCFGFMNSLLPAYLRKRLSGRLSLQFSIYTIALMGFVVWGHHMYMVGMANSVRTLYSTMTVMISVPASTKVLHWCVTLVQSNWVADVGFLFLLDFLYFFVLGGLSGMFVAHIGFDVIFHDTFYVIGHFHVMLAGAALSASFAAFYYYFSAIFGVRYSRFFAYLHYFFYTIGQLLTLTPMFWLGYCGMPRRVLDYPSTLSGWHSLATSGHLLTVLSVIFFLLMIFDSFYEGRVPTSRTQGVSRLNNRLAFFAYEQRKLRHVQAKALTLRRPVTSQSTSLRSFCLDTEQVSWEYTFKR